jgi:hypothetical protein
LYELKDAGLVAASAAAQVGGVNKIIDLGTGIFKGELIVDVSACEVASDDERYCIGLQISDSATFASDTYEVASLILGASGTAAGDVISGDTDMTTGRWVVPFHNMIADGATKRYARLYTTVSGTIATGINYKAYVGVKY